MVKTTITLEDELYKELVKEALEKYGRTRSLSRIINEKLKAIERGRAVAEKASEDIVERAFGSWRVRETGTKYVRRLRKESEKRFKRLGIQ